MTENNGLRMLMIGWAVTAKATLLVAGRIFSRFKKLGKIDTGDYLVHASLVLTTPSSPSTHGCNADAHLFLSSVSKIIHVNQLIIRLID